MDKHYSHKDVHLLLFRIMKAGKSLQNIPYYAACYPFSQWLETLLEYNEKAGAIWELYFYSAIFEKC